MTVDTELRAAAATLYPSPLEVPAFSALLRRRRHRRKGIVVAAGMLVIVVVATVALVRTNDSPKIASNPTQPSHAVSPATPLPPGSSALGLDVKLPEGWVLQSGECPAARAVTVVDQIKALPVPAGCPNVDGPWVVIQRIPRDLDGIDNACGPGFIDDMPFCQANQTDPTGNPNAFGIERRFYAGLDVLVSLGYDKRVGGPGPEFTYSDPSPTGPYLTPQGLSVAQTAITQARTNGCPSIEVQATTSAIRDCESLTFPADVAVTEVGAASLGGSVPSTYWIVSLTSDNQSTRYRVLVQNHWDTGQRWVKQTVTAITPYDGPWPPDRSTLCSTPPIDPRFQPLGPGSCPLEVPTT